ncbi:DNA polymerase alpha/epsilon subunit B-domain-containing protein [Xylariales sp. PMI_506]|nr:DNA polymerase alpha/epsilon subunit B-domain-containing protein [Xylariales sp. PMI_506]
MADLEKIAGNMLRKPSGKEQEEKLTRTASTYQPLHTYRLDKEKSYKQQYADMYFLRLTKIKPAVDKIAAEAWSETVIGGEEAKPADRVLDIRQGELCWVTGTVYMDMSLKPDILSDVSKDKWISAPTTSKKYWSEDGSDAVTLEDESGRIRLVGDVLNSVMLVTGCIVAVLGTENANGELEVIDLRFPNLPPQPDRWTLTRPPATNGASKSKKIEDEDEAMTDAHSARGGGGKIAIVSGLGFSSVDASHAMELNLLLEYLLGEALDPSVQEELSHISRLIIAGNSISLDERKPLDEPTEKKANKKYGYDASTYNALPSQLLDEFLASLLPTMPVTMLPGAQDPANASYPQQPVHVAMFPNARAYASAPNSNESGWLDSVTNPWEGEVDGWRVLGTGGQNLDDVFKYINSEDRLGMMEMMCLWRCSAPTAPDTLWSYPFQDDDPFVMKACPHLYFVGNQPEFGTKVVHGAEGQIVRLITVPSFNVTKEIVLVDTETLDVTKVKIATA